MNDERWRTAFHEAGHAVVGRCCGFRLASAEIFPEHRGGLQAQTRWAPRGWKDPPDDGPSGLVVSLAGPLAEAIYSDRDVHKVLEEGRDYLDSDLHRVRNAANRLARLKLYKSADHALCVAEARARQLLADHWDQVTITALLLYAAGRLG
jgi:hypothetical protein